MKVPTTPGIRAKVIYVCTLEASMPLVLTQPFWKKSIPMREKIEYLAQLSSARASMWQSVENQYPQAFGKMCTIGHSYITIMDEAD